MILSLQTSMITMSEHFLYLQLDDFHLSTVSGRGRSLMLHIPLSLERFVIPLDFVVYVSEQTLVVESG